MKREECNHWKATRVASYIPLEGVKASYAIGTFFPFSECITLCVPHRLPFLGILPSPLINPDCSVFSDHPFVSPRRFSRGMQHRGEGRGGARRTDRCWVSDAARMTSRSVPASHFKPNLNLHRIPMASLRERNVGISRFRSRCGKVSDYRKLDTQDVSDVTEEERRARQTTSRPSHPPTLLPDGISE